MPPSSHIKEITQQLRQELHRRREEIRSVHERGLSGVLVSAKLASLTDNIIAKFFATITEGLSNNEAEALRSNLSIVSLGSYGRRQCAPFSDVDLLFLYNNYTSTEIAELLRPLTQGLFDIGFQLGCSIRTVREAVQLSREDTVICTSLCDARLLLGSQTVFNEFRTSFEKMVKRHSKALCVGFLEARNTERNQYGESVYLLEPHVKRSRGGLRDLNVLRWLSFVELGVLDLDRLHLMGAISKFDHHRLQTASMFMLKLRNEMHFHANSQNDMLDRAEQIRIAGWLNYHPSASLLPVEHFMRDYFRHTNHIWQLVRRRHASLVSESKVTQVLAPWFRKSLDSEYFIGSSRISVTPAGMTKLRGDIGEILRLVFLSASTKKSLEQAVVSQLSMDAPEISMDVPADVRAQFYDHLGDEVSVGPMLTMLHELGLLEKFIPAMRHARFLLQFNQYHKYTVDEHCLRSVQEATQFRHRSDSLGRTYSKITDKRVLHLALLLHDLGKGFDEDHSEVGRKIAEDTARLFRLDNRSSENLVFLVHRHLSMSHLTFRRDTSENHLIEDFAKQAGDVERLRMLFVLTCADLAAVGPGVLNPWKLEVLSDVYSRTLKVLQPEETPSVETEVKVKRDAVSGILLEQGLNTDWFQKQLAALPASYITGHAPTEVVRVLTAFERLQSSEKVAWCTYQEESGVIECIAGANQGVGKGLFSRMAGVLTGEGLQILAASTDVLADELLMLRYTTMHPVGSLSLSEEELSGIANKLIEDLPESGEAPRFRRIWGQEQKEASRRLSPLPNKVRIDNSQSETFTIVEVFTFDREGLLYHLARRMHEVELVIRHAKIGTFLDQVVDVFYLTDRQGNKVTDDAMLRHLQDQIYEIISEL